MGIQVLGRPFLMAYSDLSDDRIGQNSQYLTDIVLPDPSKKDPYGKGIIGIYKPIDVKSKLESASEAWKSKFGIHYNSIDESSINI